MPVAPIDPIGLFFQFVGPFFLSIFGAVLPIVFDSIIGPLIQSILLGLGITP